MAEVYFEPCSDYGRGLVQAFERLFLAGGLPPPETFAGKRVLLKPNLLTDRKPEQAVTTHPEFVRQVIQRFLSFGARVSVGDSPASTANLQQVWFSSGIKQVCEEEGVPLISFEHGGGCLVEKHGFTFPMAAEVLDADWVINLPKVKSHALTALTASVKNMYGSVPGYAKTVLHKRYPKPEMFGHLLQMIWSRMPPSLTIVDGVVGMEGQGPANGRPIQLGFIAFGKDPFAVDLALCDVLKIDIRHVPYLSGKENLRKELQARGDPPKITSFEIPSGAHLLRLLPAWLVRTAGSAVWVRPAFARERCIACGKCVEACPVHALQLSVSLPHRPVLKKDVCISCACCHEVCPRAAIHMTQSPLLRMLKVFRGLPSK